uniref:RING-type domain-containing protein n=1 Tax=Peronospora matthiolae TaxID=2874970 RepID=A0AAV1TBR7_9STRA
MASRDRGRQQAAECAHLKAQLLSLAEESKSVLLELGSALNQRYRNRAPDHQTQQLLHRKNEVVTRLRGLVNAQGLGETGEGSQQDTYEVQQRMIEELERQLQNERAGFVAERNRLQQQLARVASNAQTELDSSLKRMLPQLRGLLDAYDREQGNCASGIQKPAQQTVTVTGKTSHQELNQRMKDMETKFDAERADLLEQASEAINAQRDISHENLLERETVLTCPISLDLFEDPVVTTCCGKTFSSGVLRQALRRNNFCPFCRAHNVSTHANRDMSTLVELHRTECLMLGLPETVATSNSPAATESSAVEDSRSRRETEPPRGNSSILQSLENVRQRLAGGQPRSDMFIHRSSVIDPDILPRAGVPVSSGFLYYDSDY